MLLIPSVTNDWAKSRFFYPHIQEINKVVTRKLLSGICCMKQAHAIITSSSWCTGLSQVSQAYCMVKFSCKQLYWFPGCNAGTQNQDFVQSLVAFEISNIFYWIKSNNFPSYWKFRNLKNPNRASIDSM